MDGTSTPITDERDRRGEDLWGQGNCIIKDMEREVPVRRQTHILVVALSPGMRF